MGRNCSQREFSHFREARDSSSVTGETLLLPHPASSTPPALQPRQTLCSRAAPHRENTTAPLQTRPKAAAAPGAARAPNARTRLAALCHALATKKAPRGAGQEEDKSTMKPLRSTTVQRKGNSIGMEGIPLHRHCRRHQRGVGQTQGAQTHRGDAPTGQEGDEKGKG